MLIMDGYFLVKRILKDHLVIVASTLNSLMLGMQNLSSHTWATASEYAF